MTQDQHSPEAPRAATLTLFDNQPQPTQWRLTRLGRLALLWYLDGAVLRGQAEIVPALPAPEDDRDLAAQLRAEIEVLTERFEAAVLALSAVDAPTAHKLAQQALAARRLADYDGLHQYRGPGVWAYNGGVVSTGALGHVTGVTTDGWFFFVPAGRHLSAGVWLRPGELGRVDNSTGHPVYPEPTDRPPVVRVGRTERADA